MAKPEIKLTDDQIAEVERMATIGLSVPKISAILNISKKTFERIMNRDERVYDAIEKGRAAGSEAVLKCAWTMATSGKDTGMTIFWLKTREQWSENKPNKKSIRDEILI